VSENRDSTSSGRTKEHSNVQLPTKRPMSLLDPSNVGTRTYQTSGPKV